MSTKVLICEDQGLFRDMLQVSLSHQPGVEVVGAVANGTDAISMTRELVPHVILMDIELGTEPNGIETGTLIKQENPSVGIVLLSIHKEREYLNAIPINESGGWSYLWKHSVSDLSTLTRAVEGTAAGLTVMDPSVVSALKPTPSTILDNLTARQLEVLQLMAQGYSNSGIAQNLVLEEKSVENYINVIYQQLQITHEDTIHSRVKAVLLYLANTQVK